MAVIQNGTTDNEVFGFGTIETIEQVVLEKKLSSPAIIIIGDVVDHQSILTLKEKFLEPIKKNIY